jgi:two-component sensor histidine kinase
MFWVPLDMSDHSDTRTVTKLLRQQAALAAFGSFAFREPDLNKILTEAARICADSLEVPFSKICRYRAAQGDLLIEAGWGWNLGVVGRVVSQADESSPQGRAYVTGQPVIIRNINDANNLTLPAFYVEHGVVSTVDVVIPAIDGAPYGVLEIDSTHQHQYDEHDINFLTGFANVLAEAVATVARVKALRDALAAKNIMAEELQHRVRSNLEMVGAMLESFARSNGDGEVREGIDLIARRVSTLAQIYESQLTTELSESIDLAEYLQALCLRLPGLQAKRKHPVRIVCQTVSVPMSLEGVTALGLAVAELVTNSYGHAFPDREGTITVTLQLSGAGRAAIRIQNNGLIFVPQTDSLHRGAGLVRLLLDRIDGTLDLDADNRTLWTMNFATSLPASGSSEAA